MMESQKKEEVEQHLEGGVALERAGIAQEDLKITHEYNKKNSPLDAEFEALKHDTLPVKEKITRLFAVAEKFRDEGSTRKSIEALHMAEILDTLVSGSNDAVRHDKAARLKESYLGLPIREEISKKMEEAHGAVIKKFTEEKTDPEKIFKEAA